MTICVMCKKDVADTDFAGRCTDCFRAYMQLSDKEDKPDLGIPFTPRSRATK